VPAVVVADADSQPITPDDDVRTSWKAARRRGVVRQWSGFESGSDGGEPLFQLCVVDDAAGDQRVRQ
jgi:hypothetical protein